MRRPWISNKTHGPLGLTSALAALVLAGCAHLGPAAIATDRFDYGAAIGESWKQQTLLNIVKLRYLEPPVFVDVSSVVGSYSLESSLNVGGTISSSRTLTLGGTRTYTDRPTITYVPMTGEKFLHGLITPIDPKNIFYLLQSGYAADFLLGLTVDAINGVRNRSTSGGEVREADADFRRALGLLRDLQAAGAFGMRVEEGPTKTQSAVVFFRRDGLPPEVLAKSLEVRRLLNLSPDAQKLVLTYSPVRGGASELAVNSRSMLQIMSAFASYVDVPQADEDSHAALPDYRPAQSEEETVHIHSGKDRPETAFAAVRYRNSWFWIDDSDLRTKRALMAMMFFFTLTETSGGEKLPLITIPAQ